MRLVKAALLSTLAIFLLGVLFVYSGHPVWGVGGGGRPVKDKVLFLNSLSETRNVGPITTRYVLMTWLEGVRENITSNMRIIARWFLYPELAGPLHIEGEVRLIVWYMASGNPDGALWNMTLRELDSEGNFRMIGSVAEKLPYDPTVLSETSIALYVNYTVAPGSTIEVSLNVKGNSATNYTIVWGDWVYDSRLILPTSDYLRVVPADEGGIVVLDSGLNPVASLDPEADNKTIYIRVTVRDSFGGYDIRWVNITVMAPDGMPLPGLSNVSMERVEGFFNSYESVYQVSLDYNGLPEGRYNITIYALDNTGHYTLLALGGYGFHLEVDSSGFFYVGPPPMEVYFRVLDGDATALGNASVYVLLGGEVRASAVTNSSGLASVRLAPGKYVVEVWWMDTLVATSSLDTSVDYSLENPLVITADVYNVSFRVVDGVGYSLEGAAVTIVFPNGRVSGKPYISGEGGLISLGRAPGGNYHLIVIWGGEVVGNSSIFVDESGVYDLIASVYYLEVRAVDLDGYSVGNALVRVLDSEYGFVVEAGFTNEGGVFVTRLPGGVYDIDVEWLGVEVYGYRGLALEGNLNMSVELPIDNVEVLAVDSRGVALEHAVLEFEGGLYSLDVEAGGAGRAAVKLPLGRYLVSVVWDGVEVYRDYVVVDGSSDVIRIGANVYYLEVYALGGDGGRVENVYVEVSGFGRVWGGYLVGGVERLVFRLPAGMYNIVGRLKTNLYWTDVEDVNSTSVSLEGDLVLPLRFEHYPIPFYSTNLFYTLVAVAILSILHSVLYLRVWRRRS